MYVLLLILVIFSLLLRIGGARRHPARGSGAGTVNSVLVLDGERTAPGLLPQT